MSTQVLKEPLQAFAQILMVGKPLYGRRAPRVVIEIDSSQSRRCNGCGAYHSSIQGPCCCLV